MFNKELADKINSFIEKKFPVIYDYKFNGLVLLRGGAIRSLAMNAIVKDLDFVILTQEKCQIIDFIRKFKLFYYRNDGGGYKIVYNDFTIDIFSWDDLYDAACYDIDLLLYDIEKHVFISYGAIRALEKRVITEIKTPKPISNIDLRLNKLIKFVKYMTKSEKKVKVKQNKWRLYLRFCNKKTRTIFGKMINNNYKTCFKYLRGYKKEFVVLLLLKVIRSIISLMIPYVVGIIFINVIKGNGKIIFLFVILFFLIFSLKLIFNILMKLGLKLEDKMTFNISSDIANGILSYQFDDDGNINNSKVFINNIRLDLKEIAKSHNNITDILVRFVCNFCLILYIFNLDYRFCFVILFFMLIIFKKIKFNMRKKSFLVRKYIHDVDNFAGSFGELFKYKQDTEIVELNLLKNNLGLQIVLFIILLIISILLVGNSLIKDDSFVILLMYSFKFFVYCNEVNRLLYNWLILNLSCCRVFNLVNGTSYINEFFGNKYKNKCNGLIEFNNVKFKYNKNTDYIIDRCSFKINANEMVALVDNGSINKIILNLITRMYDVSDGIIKIDGLDINEYSLEFLRENISVISPSSYLFDMSISDNLRIVKDDITDSKIKEVCQLACLDEFIETLPNKYDTIIGKGGIELSSLYKQRLVLARALIKKTKIILLDGIMYDDQEFYSIIKKIKKHHTIIIVTDDNKLINECDRILVLEKRRIYQKQKPDNVVVS